MNPHEVDYDYVYCKRCNKKLHDEISIDRGYGPVCYRKVQAAKAEKEFLENQVTIDEVV